LEKKASEQMLTRKLWDHAMKEKGVPAVKEEKRRNAQVYIRIIEKRVYQTLKVASNSTSILCKKEGWKEIYDTEL